MPQDATAANKKQHVTIIAANQEGDVEEINVKSDDPLHKLFREALHELYPKQHLDPGNFDLLICGVVVTDLDQTVHDAGLHDRSQVVIAPKDVSRG
jgi:hypothetical protein